MFTHLDPPEAQVAAVVERHELEDQAIHHAPVHRLDGPRVALELLHELERLRIAGLGGWWWCVKGGGWMGGCGIVRCYDRGLYTPRGSAGFCRSAGSSTSTASRAAPCGSLAAAAAALDGPRRRWRTRTMRPSSSPQRRGRGQRAPTAPGPAAPLGGGSAQPPARRARTRCCCWWRGGWSRPKRRLCPPYCVCVMQ